MFLKCLNNKTFVVILLEFKNLTMAKTSKSSSKRLKDHDIFMRGIFSFPELVLKILQFAIPPNLKPFIDFSTLKILPDTHVTDKLNISHSDTIYEAELKVSSLTEQVQADDKLPSFRFCFLGEFKSSKPDKPIDFQVEDYVRSIQQHDIKNKRPPSIVIPLLIYHGVEKWEYKRLYDYFAKYLPNEILEYVSFPKYLVIDLQAMSDDEIKKALGLGELRGAFLALKHAQDANFFKQHLADILNFVKNSSPTLLFQSYLKMLLEYSQRRSGLDDVEFIEIFEQSNPEEEMATKFKTIFEVAEERAFEKGLAKSEERVFKAIELLIRNTTLTDAQIATELEEPISIVEKIRKELNSTELK